MKSWTATALAAALLAGALLGCSDPPPEPAPAETPAPVLPPWRATVVADAGSRIRALASGDLAAHPGRELVAVGAGDVVICWFERGKWRTEGIDVGEGLLHGALIADVDPSLEGVEIVVVGETADGRGRAELLSWSQGSGWRVTRLATPPRPLHAVALLGDLVCVSGQALSVLRRSEGVWSALELATLKSPGLSLSPSQGKVLVGCLDGRLVEFAVDGLSGGVRREADRRVAARNSLARLGGHVLTADGDGTLALLPAANESGLPERLTQQDRVEIYRSPRPLTGTVLADLDPAAKGLELATCGEAGEVVLLSADADGRYQPTTLHRDVSPLHCLIALDSRTLATASEGGTITVLRRAAY